jgi:squalene-hopene/tetraprenyl-beta-curcumene cyclase
MVNNRWATKGPRWDAMVVVAAGLAISDAEGSGKLQRRPRLPSIACGPSETRRRLNWLQGGWPPMESDDYYGATIALLATGRARGTMRRRPRLRRASGRSAVPGEERASSLHHRASFLGLEVHRRSHDSGRAEEDVDELMALQRPDGGWSTPSFLPWKRADGKEPDPAISDGTAPATDPSRALGGIGDGRADRQGGVAEIQPAAERPLVHPVAQQGRQELTHAGTAFRCFALHSCGETK